MADKGKDWLWDASIVENLDKLCRTIELDEFNHFFPAHVLDKQHWEQILSPGLTSEAKVDKFLRILEDREESKVFPILSHALWRTGQVGTAKLIDPYEIYKPRTVVWFCLNEHQANAVISVLGKYAERDLVKTTRIPTTESLDKDDKRKTYCVVRATISDGSCDSIHHTILVIYLSNPGWGSMHEYVLHMKTKYNPQYVLHISSAETKALPSDRVPLDDALPIGSIIVPDNVGGAELSRLLVDPCGVQSFCSYKNSPPILESVLAEWRKVDSFSSLLSRSAAQLQQSPPSSTTSQQPHTLQGIDPQILFSAEQAGLGEVGLVGQDSNHPHSFSFVPSASLLAAASTVRDAHDPPPSVYCLPVLHPRRECRVFPDYDGTIPSVEQWSLSFSGQPQHLVCVYAISSAFQGLSDPRTENIVMQLASAVALDIVCRRIEQSHADQLALWRQDLSMQKLAP